MLLQNIKTGSRHDTYAIIYVPVRLPVLEFQSVMDKYYIDAKLI